MNTKHDNYIILITLFLLCLILLPSINAQIFNYEIEGTIKEISYISHNPEQIVEVIAGFKLIKSGCDWKLILQNRNAANEPATVTYFDGKSMYVEVEKKGKYNNISYNKFIEMYNRDIPPYGNYGGVLWFAYLSSCKLYTGIETLRPIYKGFEDANKNVRITTETIEELNLPSHCVFYENIASERYHYYAEYLVEDYESKGKYSFPKNFSLTQYKIINQNDKVILKEFLGHSESIEINQKDYYFTPHVDASNITLFIDRRFYNTNQWSGTPLKYVSKSILDENDAKNLKEYNILKGGDKNNVYYKLLLLTVSLIFVGLFLQSLLKNHSKKERKL